MASNFLAKNEGIADRVVRIVIGLAGLSLIWIGPKSLLGLFGLVPLITGITGICPLYNLFGLNTRGKEAAAS